MQRFLMLGDVIGQRTRDRVLQQHFVGFKPRAVHVLDLNRIEIHGKNADRQQYAENDVEKRNARRNGQL